MDPAGVGLRLASSAIAPLVKKLFRNEVPGAGLVDKPVRISALVSFTGEKRTLNEKDLRKLVGELVSRAIKSCGPHDALTEGEQRELTEALTSSLHSLGRLTMDDVQAVRLGPALLAKCIAHPPHLSAAADALYQPLLHLTCVHILNFFTQRSTFVARTLVDQSQQLDELIRKIDVLAERTPPMSVTDARFEDSYTRHLTARHGRLMIYGIDHNRCWPLADAYVSLEATRRYICRGQPDTLRLTSPPQRAEQALSGLERVLLRGAAGSGKSTLVQWLAVTTAKHRLGESLSHLYGRIPFVLPLRTLTRGGRELPASPADFLSAIGWPHTPPDGWAERVLSAGRGLLLVDGIDEVPEHERETTRRWLHDLLTAFPGNVWLVTARPSAIPEGWLSADGFTELSLAPMSSSDVAAFVHRWHLAAGGSEEDERDLLEAIRTRSDLSRLATNPLMCGLMCALHRTRHGYLPRGREALYDAGLRMMLEQRDQERYVRQRMHLDAPSQILLLQRLAYWLVRNGHSEMERTDAIVRIEQALPAMPQVAAQGSAADVYRHLLDRSGLLQDPTPDTVGFVHRTFQDYLAAKAAVEARDFPLLVNNAHLDQWEDVIRMAVAHARPEERGRLLTGLLKQGDKGAKNRRIRLHLLAMACLEHATQLAPEVRDEVTRRAEALIPPRTYEEARSLAAIGSVVLELLPGPEGLTDDEATAVVQTALNVGGDAALPFLARFGRHPSKSIQCPLSSAAPDGFDTPSYAEAVISRLPPETPVRVTHAKQLRHVSGRDLAFLGNASDLDEIVKAGAAERVISAILHGASNLASLTRLRKLSSLTVRDWSLTKENPDVSPLADLPLRDVNLWLGDPIPRGLERLGHTESLTVVLRGTENPLRQLPEATPVTWLSLPEAVLGLDGLSALPRLHTLSLWTELPSFTREDWRQIQATATLQSLALYPTTLQNINEHEVTLSGISSVFLSPSQEFPLCLDLLTAAFPNATSITLQLPGALDLAPLAGLPHLKRVHLRQPTSVTNADRLASHVNLTITPLPRGWGVRLSTGGGVCATDGDVASSEAIATCAVVTPRRAATSPSRSASNGPRPPPRDRPPGRRAWDTPQLGIRR